VLFGLALLIQIWAPVGASAMHGQGAAHFGHGVLCSLGEVRSAETSVPGHVPSPHDHCQLCQIVCGVSALFEVRPACIVRPYAETRRFFWTLAPSRAILFGGDQHRPPRGPPALT
jgi:hypothetical protein